MNQTIQEHGISIFPGLLDQAECQSLLSALGPAPGRDGGAFWGIRWCLLWRAPPACSTPWGLRCPACRGRCARCFLIEVRMRTAYDEALTGSGALLLMEKQVGETQPLSGKALSIDPNHAAALINMAMIDQTRGNQDSALRRRRKGIARNPDYA